MTARRRRRGAAHARLITIPFDGPRAYRPALSFSLSSLLPSSLYILVIFRLRRAARLSNTPSAAYDWHLILRLQLKLNASPLQRDCSIEVLFTREGKKRKNRGSGLPVVDLNHI